MARKKQTQMKAKGAKPTVGTTELQPEEVELDMQTETTTGAPASPVQETNPTTNTKSSSRKTAGKAPASPVQEPNPTTNTKSSSRKTAGKAPASPVQEPNPTTNTKSSSRKTAGKALGFIRRSARINTFTAPTFTAPPLELTVERALEEVVVTDSEEEDELEEPEPTFSFADKSLEEKVDHLVQLVTEQQKIIDELKSAKNESYGVNDFTYRSLYFDSQKKVEALMEEELELSKKLENAYGKIEVFEKFKDMMMMFSKGTEAAIRGAFNVGQEEGRTSPKRKRTS